ncbi:MAG: radical SAM peptide maturase [Bacteroidales bacterium]|nr:radical SAM peptide maturase [Bacteroidales bacterium]
MKKPVRFNTSMGNCYLYSAYRNQFLLLHPLLQYYFDLESSGVNLKSYISALDPPKTISIDRIGDFQFEEIQYQWKKYCLLKRNRYFDTPPQTKLTGRLRASKVTNNLTSIKQVIFEVTEDCNLSCTYCIYSKFYINKKREKREFNPDQAKQTLAYLMKRREPDQKELIVSFYGGEPLKNIQLIREIVSFLNTNYRPEFTFKFTMTTNGLLLAKYADFLVEHSFDISISLDGDRTGNSFRVLKNHRPSYDIVIKNTDFVKSRYPEYFDKHISFITVIHNKNSYQDVHDFFQKKYGKTPTVSTINTTTVNENFLDEFNKTFIERPSRQTENGNIYQSIFLHHPTVTDLADTIEKYSGFVFKNPYRVLTPTTRHVGSKEFIPTATCMPFSMRVFLTADGSILPCEHISRIFEIGTLENNEIRIDPDAVARDYNDYFDKIRPLCDRCYLADNCKECIFNTRIETETPACDYFLDASRFGRYLSHHLSILEKDYPLYQRILKEAYHEK